MHAARFVFTRFRIVLVLAATLAQPARAEDALRFFKNYFLTGDYTVAGVGLQGAGVNGFATGTINIAAGTVPAHADVLGAFLYWATVEHTPGEGAVGAKFNGADISKLAKSLGSGTPPCWSSGGATGNGGGAKQVGIYRADVLRFIPLDPATGKRRANGPHIVVTADSGSGNNTPSAQGASLVIIYRDSASYGDADLPLKSIVIYDGSYTMNQATPSMTQTIQGFYQATPPASQDARITHIVASGQANKTERLLFNGQVIASNPFTSSAGAAWDNPTFNVSGKVGGANPQSATTTVDHAGSTQFDCLSWGAIIFSTTVQDSDKDGLLDYWETNGFTDVATGEFVNLPAMGADPNVKDLFVQIDYMKGADGHSHLPSKKALDMVASAFASGPVDGGKGIHVHFDVGNNYQSPPDAAIVPAAVASGGSPISESTTCTSNCAFPNYPGTVGWKTGFRFIRDQHFAYSRKDVFHYALFAHTLGIPSDANPKIPKSTSGVSDLLGGDLMVTLGLWDNQVGTDFVQAVTLFHEIGHNLALRHGGSSQVPNCKPNYLSSMNYLFQISGLLTATGVQTIDYSRTVLPNLNEGALSDGSGFGIANLPYQSRWYVPLGSSVLDNTLGTTAATRHCDGSSNAGDPAGTSMIRVDSGSLAGAPVDWNKNGATQSVFAQDLDYNGSSTETAFTGFDDWGHIDLRQIGGRRNVVKLSLDVTKSDLAAGDSGLGDSGLGDSGLGDSGLGDSGLGDSGLGDSGLGDSGLGADLDFETAASLGNAPSGLTAVVGSQGVTLNWNAPTVVTVTNYKVYRATGLISDTNLPVLIATVPAPTTTFVDTSVFHSNGVPIRGTYTYLVIMTSGATQSGPSNRATVSR